MSKALTAARAKIEKLDLNTDKGKAAALKIAIEGRETANREMHEKRREARDWSALVRELEPKIDYEARRRRGPGASFKIIPADEAGDK